MFVDDVRRAIEAAPRVKLAELAGAVWKAFGAGSIGEDEAQALAELIEARKIIPASVPQSMPLKRRQGSRPRSSESMERRRRWTSSGWLPPQLAARFTMAETAVLSTVAAQVVKHGRCDLALDHVAALAGVGRTPLGHPRSPAPQHGRLPGEVRRLRAFRNDTNVVRIVSAEWQSWISMRRSSGQGVGAKPCAARNTKIHRGKNPNGLDPKAGRTPHDGPPASAGERKRYERFSHP